MRRFPPCSEWTWWSWSRRFCAWLATALILLSSTALFRWLGESVLTALERLMGMLLIALSVQMFLDGIAVYLGKS